VNVSVWGNVDEVVEEMKYLASPCHRSRMENLRMKVDRGMPWVKREERKAKDKGRVRVSWGLHGEMDVEPRGKPGLFKFPVSSFM